MKRQNQTKKKIDSLFNWNWFPAEAVYLVKQEEEVCSTPQIDPINDSKIK